MSHLSIRRLPPELDQAIQKEARKRNASKTDVVLAALKEAFQLRESTKPHRDVRSFFGKMTKREHQELQKLMQGFSETDPEMWK